MTLANSNTPLLPKPNHYNFIDLEGQVFKRLTVIGYAGVKSATNRQATWLCRCDCGTYITALSADLRSGDSTSCGCLSRERTRRRNCSHGLSHTPAYRAWAGIIQRCRNPQSKAYGHYGGRGIKVCERWFRFENFYADMGDAPSPKHSIDRIDNDGDYTPENCRWATWLEQSNNKRMNRQVTWQGETKTISEWARDMGLQRSSLVYRLSAWSLERVFTEPIAESKRHRRQRIRKMRMCRRLNVIND